MEEYILVFALLIVITFLSLHVLHTHDLKPRIDTLSIHLAIVEATSSPINEVLVIVVIPRDTFVIFKENTITVIGDIVDPRILAFNNSVLRGLSERMICYDPSKVWFVEKVVLYKTSVIKLVNRFGRIKVIPVGGMG